jgi:hypothetical protein
VSITAGLLKRYEANLKALVGGLREYARTRGLAYYFLQSSTPIEQVILNSMRRTGDRQVSFLNPWALFWIAAAAPVSSCTSSSSSGRRSRVRAPGSGRGRSRTSA